MSEQENEDTEQIQKNYEEWQRDPSIGRPYQEFRAEMMRDPKFRFWWITYSIWNCLLRLKNLYRN